MSSPNERGDGALPPGAVSALMLIGSLLLVAIVGFGAVAFTGARFGDLFGSGREPEPATEFELARAEATLLTSADEAAADAVAFLLMSAHDGAEVAVGEARAFAHASVSDDDLLRWTELARAAVDADPESVDARVKQSRLHMDADGGTRVTCDVVARAGDQIWRAQTVVVLAMHETPAGEVTQWELLSLESPGD